MSAEELIKKLHLLRWTQEVRPGHPWRGQTLVNRKQVEELIKEEFDGN
jgi:hypothetical protein